MAVVRAVFCVILPVGLLWCAGRSRRSVQDIVLGTYAIYDWMPVHPEGALRPQSREVRTTRPDQVNATGRHATLWSARGALDATSTPDEGVR